MRRLLPLACLVACSLDIQDNPVTSLAPLAGAVRSTHLHANRTKVTDVRPIAALPELAILQLHGTGVRDLAPLAGLPE